MKICHRLYLLLSFLITLTSCQSQPSSPYAPESGTYTGGTLNVTGTMNYSYNPVTGFGMQSGTSVTPGVNVSGEMAITNTGANKGTYSFSKLKDWKGNWAYDPEKDKIHFTGPAKDALRYYHAEKGAYQFTFVIKTSANDKDGIAYSYAKKASKPFPKLAKPNGDLKGMFTVKPDLNTVAFLDVATASIQKNFPGHIALTNNNHYTIGVGFTDNTKYYQISITDPSGNTKQYSSSQIMSYNWKFLNYKYALPSNDQHVMALLGQTPDSYLNLTYTPGYLAIGVFDMSGHSLGIFPGQDNTFIIPSFLPDGRLLYCPKGGGMAITDGSYKKSQRIYTTPVNALAVAPDGKTIAFSEGLHFTP
jgi:hypothetical protein